MLIIGVILLGGICYSVVEYVAAVSIGAKLLLLAMSIGAIIYALKVSQNLIGPMFCPHCDKHIPADMRWRCPYCDAENDAAKHSLIEECGRCKREPKAYCCHHCNELIFLDSDNDASQPAVNAVVANKKPTPRSPDNRELKAQEHAERKEEIEREIEIAALNRRLVQLKSSPEFKQEASAQDKLQKDYSEHEAATMGVQMLERSERIKIFEECQDDPDISEMKNLTLDAFVEEHGLTPKRYSPENEKGTTVT